ncbi:antitoxin MazE [Acidocella aquatica]|uniref:Antitoxin MazE n=1 Tax=Acidocella aquatica TaxID=1922313 RepID=A0ABQ6A4T8_9PROT|nr:AbrB/MazE/SpoVT family DNA-binding domain-containing protein [Acidocella aquatica]GLR66343.1 antitoxin MazE [Acidocella aquatica]
MQSQVKKWGNSASVRIPAAILDAVHVSIDQDVDIRAENGRIVIEPMRKPVTLESLLLQVTPDNLHGEVDFGSSAGREIF